MHMTMHMRRVSTALGSVGDALVRNADAVAPPHARHGVDEASLRWVLALRQGARVQGYAPHKLAKHRARRRGTTDFGYTVGSMSWTIAQAKAIDGADLDAWLRSPASRGYLVYRRLRLRHGWPFTCVTRPNSCARGAEPLMCPLLFAIV